MRTFILVMVVALILLIETAVSAQDFLVQMAEGDNGLWHIECRSGCDFWESLGTEEELNREFEIIWDGIDHVYMLMERRFGVDLAPLPRPS